jgi:hydroxymethylglutaryl-CoA lyase
VEVGPRDGLQNETAAVDVSTRIALIHALADAGLKTIECGSFVSPVWVPQMADSAAVFAGLKPRPGVAYTALVPNLKGLVNAIEANVSEVAVFVAASEEFSKRNINCTIARSLERAAEVARAAASSQLRVRGYVSCVLGCPFSGEVEPSAVARTAAALYEMGCYEVSLGDTIGVGTPLKAQRMLEAVSREVAVEKLAVHYHDTWGQALANILASLELGVAVIDSSIAGLGGCPYAPGATGNVATEDVIYLLNGMGIETGVDLQKVAAAGRMICDAIGKQTSSKVARALKSSSVGAGPQRC